MLEAPLHGKGSECFRGVLGSSVTNHDVWKSVTGKVMFEFVDDCAGESVFQIVHLEERAKIVNHNQVVSSLYVEQVCARLFPWAMGNFMLG